MSASPAAAAAPNQPVVLAALPAARPLRFYDAHGIGQIGEPYEAPGWIRFFISHGGEHRQGHWLVEHVRFDESGCQWRRTAWAVIDDFGDLVEVAS